MVRSPRGPGRALIIKRFFTLDAIDAGRPMPAPGSPAYFEHAIEHILREIAKVEVRARYQSRLLRPWRAWQLRKLRNRLRMLLDLARAQEALAALRASHDPA